MASKLLLDWINKSSSSILGCIQRHNNQSQSHMFCLFFCFLFPCAPRLRSLWRRDSILPDLEAHGECHADKQRSKQSELIFQGDLRTQRSLKVVPLLAQFLHTVIPQQQLSPGVSDRKHSYLHFAFHPRLPRNPLNTLCTNLHPSCTSSVWGTTRQKMGTSQCFSKKHLSLESQHDLNTESLLPFRGGKNHAANHLLASCRGCEQPYCQLTGVGITALGWSLLWPCF